MRHYVIAGILVIVGAILTYLGLMAANLMPVEASVQSISIDWLWHLEMITISFLFALIVVPLFYSLVVFRRKRGDDTDGKHMEGNMTLEITWTVIPLFLVVAFAYMGAYSLGETRRVDPNAMIIKVTGFQWAWKFDYPSYGFSSDELHLPVDKQVLLQMESPDVIHSFWVPEFRIKQDVVPGRITQYRVTPSLIGDYKVRCSELCGISHAYMEAPVIVVSQQDFDAWATQQKAAAEALANTPGPEAGRATAQSMGCFACHTTDGSKLIGPTWRGLYESQVHLADGTTVTADEAYLKQSILEPQSQVVNGFPPMSFNPQAMGITDLQVSNIIEYIKTLK
jgi:cytochrome c oxidase subunit 2